MTEQSKILVVEDDQSLREAIYETLRLSGFDSVTVSNGEDALALLERQKVSLVLSDVQMPEMDGNELLKRVRAVRSDLPFVLMTAFGSIEKAVEAIQEGATDYLV
ncbi:MAG: response regulator, partial [Pseudohongiellaceae bacterium]